MIAAASALASRFAVATALDRIAPARVDARAPRRAVIECAHKKGTGSTKNGRDSNPQYRGIKKFGGEKVIAGNIIVRQCGTKWHPGNNVGLGTDYTIYSLIEGVVKFEHKSKSRYKVSVYPVATAS